MNVMVEYLKINKNFVTQYIKTVLGKMYNKKITDEFYKAYVEQRYYYVDEQLGRTNIKTAILKKIDKTKRKLISEDKDNKTKINETAFFYNYVLYFDNVINSRNINKVIMQIVEQKSKKTGKEEPELQKNIYDLYIKYQKEIQNFLQKFNTTKFELELKKCNCSKDVKTVVLKQKIKIPLLYSDFAIEKAMETEPIVEDKCLVEYYLIANKILNDILKCDTQKEYIVEFPISILSKKQKTKRLLEIINFTLMQSKIILKIDYKNFNDNKETIYQLIQQGYKFCINIDEDCEISSNDMKRLENFAYILVKNIAKYKNKEYKLNLIQK